MITQDPDKRKSKQADPRKCSWKDNYENESLSGIEFRKGKTNEIVNFIAIKHDEILDDNTFRIAVKVADDDTFTLPPKQTFEEMIQSKRRQQMMLYGSGNATSTSTSLSDRAARRVAAAARRQQAFTAAISRQRAQEPQLVAGPSSGIVSARRRPTPRLSARSRKGALKRRSPKRPVPASPVRQVPIRPTAGPSNVTHPTPPTNTTPASVSYEPLSDEALSSFLDTSGAPPPPNKKVVTSVKELFKHNPNLSVAVQPKRIKMLLKDAPPGATIEMPDGTVLKKSRRGGARAGAGRKRSRPPTMANGNPNESNPGNLDDTNTDDALDTSIE